MIVRYLTCIYLSIDVNKMQFTLTNLCKRLEVIFNKSEKKTIVAPTIETTLDS